MLLHPAPRRVLRLGFGAGNAASSILAHPVERLDVVDPTGLAAETAPYFDETNLDVLSDERLAIHDGDPWGFLARTDRTWDLIGLPVRSSEHADLVEVPTVERLRLARSRLAARGGLALEVNVGRASIEEIRSVLRTMGDVFPRLSVWSGPLGYTWVVYGTDGEPRPALAAMGERLRDPNVEAELLSLDLGGVSAVLGHHVRSDDRVLELAGDAPPITEDRPRIDDLAGRSADTFYGLGGAAADTPLADLTAPGTENAGLRRLFENLQRNRALAEAAAPPGPPAP